MAVMALESELNIMAVLIKRAACHEVSAAGVKGLAGGCGCSLLKWSVM